MLKFLKNLFGKKKSFKIPETKESQVEESKQTVVEDINSVSYWVGKFEEARQNRDPEEMQNCLMKAKEACTCSNTNCLTEIFCPECPMGGFAVASGRAGL